MAIIDVGALRAHLGIDDTEDDAAIQFAVDAANQVIVEYCGRSFDKTALASETARLFRPSNMAFVDVDEFWGTTNLLVKTDENDDGIFEATWTLNTDFLLEPLNGQHHGQTWPYSRIVATGTRLFPSSTQNRATLQVTAAWGWAAVPDAVFMATLIEAARLFGRRKSPEGVIGGFADFTAIRISRFDDPDVVSLLEPFRDVVMVR